MSKNSTRPAGPAADQSTVDGQKAAPTDQDGLGTTTPTIGGLVHDTANRRQHGSRNVAMMAASIQQVGAARSIVVDEANVILAGNGVTQAAAAAGITKVRFIDAGGDELIAVRRSGLTADQKRSLALFDNRTAELAEWNIEQLAADLANGDDLSAFFLPHELSDLGIEVPTFEPVAGAEQGRLDQKTPVTCPQCGHEFTP
jgi:ParB family transcriptional regulator, chromosome partitioning protein